MSEDLQKTNVAEGKPVTIDDIRLCLDMEDIKLVEHLSKKYNSI